MGNISRAVVYIESLLKSIYIIEIIDFDFIFQ